jgi:hypothetical protein
MHCSAAIPGRIVAHPHLPKLRKRAAALEVKWMALFEHYQEPMAKIRNEGALISFFLFFV